MNKKALTLLSILALAVVMVSGCAGNTASAEALPPIDPAAWPTPVPAKATLPPTPFPKISLADVATPTPAMLAEAVVPTVLADAAESQPVAPAEAVVSAPDTAGLTPATGGTVTVSAVNVRQSPQPDAAKLGVLTESDPVEVLALNPKQDWALVKTGILTGWVSLEYLTLDAPADGLPTVKTTVSAPAQPAADNAPAENPQPEAVSYQPVVARQTVPGLGPIGVAHITTNPVMVRPGPGVDFAAIGELTEPVEKLTLLAVDPTHRWVLAAPEFETSRTGWVAVDDIQLTEGDLTAAPEIATGWTTSNDLALRTGPGIYAEEAGRLAINNLIRVVGLNDGRSWALVQPLTGPGEGWVQARFLTFSQPMADLPLAPAAPPVAAPASLSPAVSQASAKQGRLVFQTSSGGDIMTVKADGSDLRRLTHGLDPALSPDGQTVAFTRWDQGEGANGSVWLIGIDGSNERQLLGFVKQPKGPEWSPDGTQVVINYQHEGRLEEKEFTTTYTEGHAKQIPWNAGKPSVEVVGKTPYLHYHLPPDPHWGLRVIDVASGAFEDKAGGTYAFRPAWDPRETWRLVSDGGQGLVEVDVNRNTNQAITHNGNDGSPVFSPDGQFIAVTVGKPGGGDGFDIYRLNRDGGGRVQLTRTPLYESVMPEAQGKQWSNVSPAWSPDGSQIAFLTNRTGQWQIWVMNFDGSHQRAMFTDEVNNSLNIQYNFVDERALSWR